MATAVAVLLGLGSEGPWSADEMKCHMMDSEDE